MPNSPAARVLAALHHQGSLEKLAGVIADTLLHRTVGELAAPRATAEAVCAIVLAACRSDEAIARLVKPLHDLVAEWHEEKERLHALLPAEVAGAVRDLAGHPVTPDAKIVRQLLTSDPVRDFMRDAVSEAIDATTQRSGLMGFGKKMAEQAVAKTGALGAMVEKRTGELVDAALDALVERAVHTITDPKNARDQAALRRALVESALSLRGRDLAREIHRAHPDKIAAIIRRRVEAWAARPESVGELETLLNDLLGDDLARPARDVLTDLRLYAEVRAALTAAAMRGLAPVVASPAFAAWLTETLAGA